CARNGYPYYYAMDYW
nr:immunoglobulin heavy chain junction region [Mus musculus]MBK4196474.1 immunoglobulin heavy chain junction region [Mus musculus]